ncbi:hypothetical protein G6F56_005777 [Rhizopus delemar]|nr:hypothetical protein G6F56_005777 [Rhizopus delemar]
MKIACCQFDPKLGAVESNMALVDDLLKDYKPGDIQVLVLPEMAFTGYVFNGIEEIKPYLEDSKTGPTVNWSKTQGLEKYFRDSANEEREHAQKLIDYINTRGGRVILRALQAPETDWKSAKNAVESALQLEKGDPQMCDFIEATYLGEQVEAIKKLSDMVTQLNRVGEDRAIFKRS